MTLETDGVELYFNHKVILNNIYLKAETGKITGILGSNGCGKSSLLKIIFGTLRPKCKSIRIDGKHHKKPLFRSRAAKYLPQFHFLIDHLTIKSICKTYNVDFLNLISHFDLFKRHKNAKFKELSGGEKRILEVFIILKSPSKIVLLDEPFTHIAPLHFEKIKELILEEKHQKIIIITDHLYKHIVDLSDDIYLIKDGFSKKIAQLNDLEYYKYINIT